MIDLPIILTNTRDDEIYGIRGRALAFAISFEINCKSLQALMEMKKGITFADKQTRENFCNQLEKQMLGKRIDKINKELKDSAKFLANYDKDKAYLMEYANKMLKDKLNKARKARNEIAHDVGKGIEHCVENEQWRNDLIKELETHVRKIAEADVLIYNLCQQLTNEPTIKGDYCETAVKWVFGECEE